MCAFSTTVRNRQKDQPLEKRSAWYTYFGGHWGALTLFNLGFFIF